MAKEPIGDVVVVLPGILGSALEKDGRTLWDMSAGAALRALVTLGRSVKDLTLDGDDPDADDLGDGVRPTRILPDLHLLPGLWKIDGYGAMTKGLRSRFDLKEDENYFEFAYDWRRDNRVAARRLRRESHRWLKDWRRQSGNDDARLVLLAHSMGGLVARAFLELEEGWADTRTLVTFGTPHRGSLNAADFIANGFRKRLGPLTLVDLTLMLRSLTSVYQLLPTYPCIDDGGGPLRRPAETNGFPHLDLARAGEALAFHRAIEKAVADHEKDSAYLDGRPRLEPIVGTDQPTSNAGKVAGDKLAISQSIDGDRLLGDGTVPRPSAYPPEWADAGNAVFSGQPHASIHNEKPVLDHVGGLITATTLDLGRFRKPEIRLGLVTDDVWEQHQGAEVTVETNEPEEPVTVIVTEADSGAEATRITTPPGEIRTVQVPGLAEGAYRVTLEATGARVTDPVLVL
jgi:hypothetical protein